MHTHEYQAKIILREFGIPIPDFAVVADMNELNHAIKDLHLAQAVLKVQIHAGGRGKAGGVKLARSYEEIIESAKQLLGMKIINDQTGKEGIVAREILISPLIEYVKEYYVGIAIDRHKAKAILILSPEGGTEIEELAVKSPEKILTCPIENDGKIKNFRLIQIEKFMHWEGKTAEQGRKILEALARAFIKTDASLVEINPLVLTADGQLIALDAKLSIDANALYRQARISAFYDPTQSTIYEAQANLNGLSYIALDGEIGCMVNGAGLAMATMDIIKYYGGTPANFLDVGGGASQEKVAEGFKIILSDPKVKAILVNIFGGIMNCVTLAAGIIAAASELEVQVPLIVRMEGTNVEQGKKMLENSGLNITIANSLDEAAQKAVAAANLEIQGNTNVDPS
jgi:succinyl-CoA synthetase beta subunit